MPKVSIIIPVYNRQYMLNNAVRSVASQTFKDYELIIVDDGSSEPIEIDGNIDIPLKIIRQPNKGVSTARNAGIKIASGEIIAFLDSDDEWLPMKLEKQIDYFTANNYRINQTDEFWIRNGVRVNPKNRHEKKCGDFFKESLELCLVSPSAVAMCKTVFDDYGYFDESLRVCEDYDFWLRILAFEEIGFLSEKLINKHGGHEGQLSASEWGMDRFRIFSMLKLLLTNTLCSEKKISLEKELIKKINVVRIGAEKRNNTKFLSVLFNAESAVLHGSKFIIDDFYKLLMT